jgi:plastocyanin
VHPVFAIENPEFVVVGALLAVWAVVLAALGVRSHAFPLKGGGERTIMLVSGLLAAGAIAMGIAFAHNGPKGGAEAAKLNKGGAEGAGVPSKGATPAANPGAPAAGGGKKQPTGGASQTLTLSADPSGALKFNTTSLQGKAGTVKLVMQNPAPIPHNISLQGPGGVNLHGPTIAKGGTSQVSATLKPGSYTFYCSVPGHRQAGMQGTLTVK